MDKIELNKKLIVALDNKDMDAIKECVEQGADVNTFEIDGKKYNPLYCCIITENAKALDYLIKNGADVTEKLGNRKQSLLFCACAQENPSIFMIAKILENGGTQDVHYAPEGARSPMDLAKEANNQYLVQTFNRAIRNTQNKGR